MKSLQKGKVNKDMGRANYNLLDILVKARTVKALDKAAGKNIAYRKALKQQDKKFDKLDEAGLSKEQTAIVDRALSAVNNCGAIYGAIAYRLGLLDGVKLILELMSELKKLW